ncbi:MAG: CBS domain-containing protein [Candidatus Altiarchaeales archaeon]|nr:CBS domain-containing protein [Candidatus Altiarchaeota archaeon]MBU4341807.1 CBS domain-containing protein [Candidatus Altiarchaeota archaeon]MCG2781989.1 CBS domain-containing protein [Candidatus Altiarchaeales archaeon]
MKPSDYFKKLRKEEAIAISETEQIGRLTAKDAMIKPVFLYPDDGADRLIDKLKRRDTNVCIVVTKDKKFMGEIGEEDIIKLFLHQVNYEPLTKILNVGYGREFLYKKAKELINKHKSTVKFDTPINKVVKLIYKEGFQYIPVLDNDKKVMGVVTPSSLIDLLLKY